MKLFVKIIDGTPETTCANDDDVNLIAQITADGFKPYDDSAPMPSAEELRAATGLDPRDSDTYGSLSEAVPTYRDDGERIVLEWRVVQNSPSRVAAEIARLRSKLADTDYRIIKSYECSMVGETSPYDLAALHADRQALRDRIGELDGLLAK